MNVYLAGYINNEVIDSCIAWRKKLRGYYHNYKGQVYPIIFFDPLNGELNEQLNNEGLETLMPPKLIMLRDYISVVKKCDVVVANMDTFGRDRCPFGTVMEVAWAWEHHKPVIVIDEMPDTESPWALHPMFKTATSHRVKNVEELIELKLLNFMYKGWNNAIY